MRSLGPCEALFYQWADEIGQGSWFQVFPINRYVKPFCYDIFGSYCKGMKPPTHTHFINADFMAEMECSMNHL